MFNWKSWFGSSKKNRFVNLSFYRELANFYRVKMVWVFDIIVIKSKRTIFVILMISDDQRQFSNHRSNWADSNESFHVYGVNAKRTDANFSFHLDLLRTRQFCKKMHNPNYKWSYNDLKIHIPSVAHLIKSPILFNLCSIQTLATVNSSFLCQWYRKLR